MMAFRIILPVSVFGAAAALAVAQPRSSAGADPAVPVAPLVITATLLTESPATVSRVDLSGSPMAERSLAALSERSANVHVATNEAHSFNDTFALRGLTNTPIFGEPAVSFYLDDLPLGAGFTVPVNLAGFATAEIHRGPSQNTVYGRAGSAGVVTLHTPRPGRVPQATIAASVGSFEARSAALTLQTAAAGAGGADAYVAAGWQEREGYLWNETRREDVDHREGRNALARVRFRPSATSEWILLSTVLRARDGAQPLVPLGGSFDSVKRRNDGYLSVDAVNAALTGRFETSVGRLSTTTSATDWELGPYASVLAFGPAELFNGSSLRQRLWSEEIRLESDAEAGGRWHVGLFASDGETEGAFRRAFGSFVLESSAYAIDARHVAVFGERTVRWGDAVTLTIGARAEESRRGISRVESAPSQQRYVRDQESRVFLPKLAGKYDLDTQTALFASVGAGFKPGGYSAFTGNRALAEFGPERTRVLEAGLTRTSSDRRVALTVRLFGYGITGYQIERSFATNAAADDYLVVNAPKARSLGAELEWAWRPQENLAVLVDLGVTNVTLREFRDPYTGENFAGRRAPYVPDTDGSLRVEWGGVLGWKLGAAVARTGRIFYTEGEESSFAQDAVTLLGAEAGYSWSRWSVRVSGRNLTDERYYSAMSPGAGHGTPGAPRTWSLEVTASY
jgi:outer membrane receptor protein involved in Fe transport